MYTFSWKKFFIHLQPNHLPLCVSVSFCPTSWFSNVALASSWVEKMKTDLYQLIRAVTQDTFNIVYEPFTMGNNYAWLCIWKRRKKLLMTFNVENGESFLQPLAREPVMFLHLPPTWNRQNNCFLTGFFRLLSQETWAFMADFTSRWAKIALNLGTLLYFPKV